MKKSYAASIILGTVCGFMAVITSPLHPIACPFLIIGYLFFILYPVANYIEEKKGILTNTSKYTEYSKRVLVLTAEGKDARNVGGYNLFKYISDLSLVKEQGLNGPIWALLAVNCHPEYSFPDNPSAKEQNSEAALVNFLLQSELSGGGWALMGSNADSDVTGMTLQALAPYYHKAGYENVTAAIDRGLARLSEMQNDSGGYSTMGVETEESCAQVITALCSLGIDPETDSRFIKGGHWTIENLITYHIAGSGFMHVKAGAGNNGGAAAGTLDGMATEQGYYALVAYQRLKDSNDADKRGFRYISGKFGSKQGG